MSSALNAEHQGMSLERDKQRAAWGLTDWDRQRCCSTSKDTAIWGEGTTHIVGNVKNP